MQEKREKHLNNPDDKTYFFPVEQCITVVKEFLFSASMMMSYLLHDKQKRNGKQSHKECTRREKQNGVFQTQWGPGQSLERTLSSQLSIWRSVCSGVGFSS